MVTVLKEQESLNNIVSEKNKKGLIFILVGIIAILFQKILFVVFGVIFLVIGLTIIESGKSFKKGAVGEKLVSQVLNNFPDDWFIINDIIVGKSQIDHIIVCPKGVYTIETKHHRGIIFGNANKQNWHQKLNRNCIPFYSPLKQANRHSFELSKYLKECSIKKWVNTIVVFTNQDVKLKVYSPTKNVIYLSELRTFLNNQQDHVNSDICNNIVECLIQLVPPKA